MKKQLFIIVIIISSAFHCIAQKNKKGKKSDEIGLFLGSSYYIGDLNPLGHFGQFTKAAGGLVFRHNFNPRLAARANALFGNIEAHDAYSKSAAQKQRNLNFKSPIYEISAQLEFNFLEYEIGNESRKFSPYIFAGLGVFKFKPYGNLDNAFWIQLQPLGTEGQGLNGKKKYKLTQLSIPFGLGIKTHLSRRIGLTLEWGMRKTFTDYLDDVSTIYYDPAELKAAHGANAAQLSDPSTDTDPNYPNVGRQRGNPTTKDWYSFAGMALTIKFKEKRKRCPGVN